MSDASRAIVFAVGDVFVDLPDRDPFCHLRPLLQSADVVFGNCEGVYSDRPSPAPTHKSFCGTGLDRGRGFRDAGFTTMTLANNHIVDGGYEGLSDTIRLLRDQGIDVTGAGANLAEALTPAIVERDGVRIAFLGFCTVYPVGYEARPKRAGLAPLRVRTFYADPDPNFWEPGIDPVIQTVPDESDLPRYREAISAARATADVVIVANHWGYSSWVEVIQDYELELARLAVDSGADAVVCHHHHALRGVEVYDGKPIFYGLGALVHHFTSIDVTDAQRTATEARFGARASMRANESLPLFPYRADAHRTGAATFEVDSRGIAKVGFIPAMMLADGSTEPLRPDDPRAEEVAGYLERLSADAGFGTRFSRTSRGRWLHLMIDI